MSTIYYIMGIPGSGKSILAKILSREKGIPILSSGKKYAELQAQGREFMSQNKAFDIIAREAFHLIKNGQDFIWNSTGINPPIRRREINHWRKLGAKIEGFLMVVPREIAIARNLEREIKVPQKVIDRYSETLINNALDTEADLFDEISIVNEKGGMMKVYNRELAKEYKFEAKISPREFTPRQKLK